MPEFRTISLTVGTAGHIDHGKTELVKFLTGCCTDRLPEERSRGMTIDLGFATCELPDHRRVGIVDVPGHERFIHNMVAGAAGMDVVILVIAADDGVMPQTIEHFHIVRMLGVASGMIVVSKTDLVSAERVEAVKTQARELVAGSMLAGSEIVGFSARTGEGFDEFYDTFIRTVDRATERNSEGAFRLHVERAFVIQGLGTIISGIPSSGRVKVGDTLELLPAGGKKAVRGIQVYGNDSDQAVAGECVGLRMGNISRDEIARGMVLGAPGFFSPTLMVNARFQSLPSLSKPLKPRTAIRFHTGTSDIPGYMVLPTLESMPPGGEDYVQFQLKRPVIVAPGDFFVVRCLSPVATIGGGYVVSSDSKKLRRRKGNWADACREREEAFRRPETRITYVLEQGEPEIFSLRKLANACFLNEDAICEHIRAVAASGALIELPGERFVHLAALDGAKQELSRALEALHDARPVSLGFPKAELFKHLKSARLLTTRALDDLMACGRVVSGQAGLFLPERITSLPPAKQKLADTMETIYRDAAFVTPRPDELPEKAGAPAAVLAPILEHLIQRGILVKIDEKVILHADHLAASRAMLTSYIESMGSMTSGTFKGLLETTRKYAIPILEYWDEQKLTKRNGNERVLRAPTP